MPGAHSRLSPSGASFWMGCPGGPNRIASLDLPPERSSPAAAEGTAAHLIRELCLDLGFEAYDFIGTEIRVGDLVFECDSEMAGYLQPGIDRAREFAGRAFVEIRVDTTPWVGLDSEGNRQFGTLDYGVAGVNEIVISDLKFGAGVAVQAVGNKQLRIYALAFWNQVARHISKAGRIRIIIDQPRNAAGGGEWVISLDELLAFGEEVKAASAATRDPNAKCTPSEDACMWCRAKSIENACPEFEAWNLEILGLTFDDLDAEGEVTLLADDGLTKARRRYVNANAAVIRKWLDRCHANELADLLEGGPAHGVKAVLGRKPPRKHRDDAESEAWLRNRGLSDEKLFKKSLITVAQLDKELGKGVFPKTLVEQGDPKPTIVPVEDERSAVQHSSGYDNLDEDLDI